MFVFVASSYCTQLSINTIIFTTTMSSSCHFGGPLFGPLDKLRYRWLAVGASEMLLRMVSDVRHCCSSHSTMSSGHNLLAIPPILPSDTSLPAAGATTAYNESSEGVQVPDVDDMSLLPPPSPAPTVPPTSSRSLRGQTSRSFAKSRDPTSPVAGSSATSIIGSSDIQALARVGMKPAAVSESAQQARGRHNENEARLADFVVSLERDAAKQSRELSQRLRELTLLVNEGRAACVQQMHSPAVLASDSITATSLVDTTVVQELRSAVVEDRLRITEMVDELGKLRDDIESQNSRGPSGVPFIPQLPPPYSSRPKRLLDDQSSAPLPKRLRTDGQPFADVVYGPVDPEGTPRVMAEAAVGLISGLHPEDVFNAKFAQRGYISIRFQDHGPANRFIESITEAPLLEGQTAVPAGLRTRGASAAGAAGSRMGESSRPSPGLSPLEILRGVGKSARRR